MTDFVTEACLAYTKGEMCESELIKTIALNACYQVINTLVDELPNASKKAIIEARRMLPAQYSQTLVKPKT